MCMGAACFWLHLLRGKPVFNPKSADEDEEDIPQTGPQGPERSTFHPSVLPRSPASSVLLYPWARQLAGAVLRPHHAPAQGLFPPALCPERASPRLGLLCASFRTQPQHTAGWGLPTSGPAPCPLPAVFPGPCGVRLLRAAQRSTVYRCLNDQRGCRGQLRVESRGLGAET